MVKKRIFSFFLALFLLIPLLVSCSSDLAATEEKITNMESETVENKTTEAVQKDPSADNELNVLLLGNSNCTYWPDELYGLMTAAGFENVSISYIYYSGCSFQKHWEWYVLNEAHYDFVTFDASGKNGMKNVNLDTCLQAKKWDVISFAQNSGRVYDSAEGVYESSIREYLPRLLKMIRKRFPNAKYCFQQLWAQSLGKDVNTLEEQEKAHRIIREASLAVSKDYDLTNIPMGDAWASVRHDPLIREGDKTLTTRIFLGKPDHDDKGHDGDVGGGQYLNACVFLETVFGKSCVGNTFRPQYTFEGQDLSLSEEKIALLQNAAHQAVENAEKL